MLPEAPWSRAHAPGHTSALPHRAGASPRQPSSGTLSCSQVLLGQFDKRDDGIIVMRLVCLVSKFMFADKQPYVDSYVVARSGLITPPPVIQYCS